MTIGTNNWEDEMTTIKAMQQKFTKESNEKEAHIKLQGGNITKLTRKLQKSPTRSFRKKT